MAKTGALLRSWKSSRTARAARRPRAGRAAPEQRQEAILKAALDVFSEHGFAATRLEDVAQRAGVAKGTLYLYFSDKESLFESVLQSVVAPALGQLASLAEDEATTAAQAIEALITFFETQLLNTPREKVLRLIISEGPRFPRLAKFYYDNVVSKGIASIRAIMARGTAGSASIGELERFPQLLFAPFLTAVVWHSLFSEFESLDVPALLAAHKQILLKPEREA